MSSVESKENTLPHFPKVNLVFVGPYAGDPSSVFGHLFLYIDQPNTPLMLSKAFGFSAQVGQENIMTYIYKGLTGGFSGKIVSDEYFKLFRRYSSVEDREVYIFELNIPAEKHENLINYLTNNSDFSRPYYFLSYNCTSFIRELLREMSIYTEGNDQKLEDYPYILIKDLVERGIVKLIEYGPARVNKLNRSYSKLDAGEKYKVNEILPQLENDHAVWPFPETENQKSFFSALYDYERTRLESSIRLHNIGKLIQGYQPPIDEKKLNLDKYNAGFLNTHRAQRMMLSMSNEGSKSLSYRHALHGQKEGRIYGENHDSMEVFDLQLTHKDNAVNVSKLNLVELYSLKNYSNVTKLISKKIQIQTESIKVNNENVKLHTADFLLGISRFGESHKFFLLTGLEMGSIFNQSHLSSSSMMHYSFYPSPRNQIYGEARWMKSINHAEFYHAQLEFGGVQQITSDFRLRANIIQHNIGQSQIRQVTFSGLYYF